VSTIANVKFIRHKAEKTTSLVLTSVPAFVPQNDGIQNR